MGPGDQAEVTRHGNKCLCPLSQLTGSPLSIFEMKEFQGWREESGCKELGADWAAGRTK